jgi:hypothetical protein
VSWVTWRQHRGQALVTTGFLAVLLLASVIVAGRLAEVALPWLAVVPAAVGLFRGAPLLARETRRLALLVRLGELSGAVVLAGLAVGVLLTAGTAPVPGVVPAAWWLFAFVLGTTVGALVRRPLPAVAVALAGFLAASGSVVVFDGRENQWAEAGILLLATTLLGGVLAHRVARRGAST